MQVHYAETMIKKQFQRIFTQTFVPAVFFTDKNTNSAVIIDNVKIKNKTAANIFIRFIVNDRKNMFIYWILNQSLLIFSSYDIISLISQRNRNFRIIQPFCP